jgi:gluconate 2-dehydrogenase gamma chain
MTDNDSRNQHLFFDEHEWSTIDAAIARIIPADHEPGAREAGVTDFIDRFLSGVGFVHARADGSGFTPLRGKAVEAWQERVREARVLYRDGVRTLDDLSREAYGAAFAALSTDQQDSVLGRLEKVAARRERGTLAEADEQVDEKSSLGGAPPSNQPVTTDGLGFFDTLVLHVRQGFYADPVYGGNRDRIGWKVIGYPGPASMGEVLQRTYTTVAYLAEDET